MVPKDDKIRQLKTAISSGDGNWNHATRQCSTLTFLNTVQTIREYKVPDDDDDFENLRNIPPPVFTTVEAPFNYSYKQNASVVRVRVRQPDGSVSECDMSHYVCYTLLIRNTLVQHQVAQSPSIPNSRNHKHTIRRRKCPV